MNLNEFIKKFGTYLIVAVILGITFHVGYDLAKQKYQKELAEYRLQSASLANKQYEELNAKYQSSLETIALLNSRISVITDQLGDSVQRVQYYGSRVEQLSKDSSKPDTTNLTRCVKLLTEGAGLSGESGKLLKNLTINKEAITKLINGE